MSVRPTFMGFYTSRSGIVASQANQDITAHNLTNMLTPGYTRQRADLVAVGDSGYKNRWADKNGLYIGQGTNVIGTTQLRDAGYDVRYREANTKYGYQETRLSALEDLNRVLDEFKSDSETGIFGQIGEFYEKLEDALNDSQADSTKSIVRNQANTLRRIINESAKMLQSVKKQQQDDFQITVDKINTTMQKIATLNQQIKEDALYGNPAHELKDDRNLLLDELSGYINMDYRYDPDNLDELTVNWVLDDGSKVPLVKGDKFATVDLHFDEHEHNGNTVFAPHIEVDYTRSDLKINGEVPTNRIVSPADCGQGSVGGYFDFLTGDGDFGVDADNRGLPYYEKMLDSFANTFAQTMNDINRGKITVDAEGNVTPPITLNQIQNLVDTNGKPIEWKDPITGDPMNPEDITKENMKSVLAANRDELNKGAYVYGNEKNLFSTKDTESVAISATVGQNPPTDNTVDFTKRYWIGDQALSLEDISNLTDKAGKPLFDPPLTPPLTEADVFDAVKDKSADIIASGAYLDGKQVDFNKLVTNTGTTKEIDLSKAEYGYSFGNADQVLSLEQIKQLTNANGNVLQWQDENGNLMSKADIDKVQTDADLETFLKNNAKLLQGGVYLQKDVTAANIVVSDQWLADPQVFTNTLGNEESESSGNEDYGNEVIRRMIAALNNDENDDKKAKVDFYGDNGYKAYTGSFQGFISFMEVTGGTDENVAKTVTSTAQSAVVNLDENRMSISGVDENEEVANMMMFTKAFSASSRMMTTMDEMLDVLINKTGLVGR